MTKAARWFLFAALIVAISATVMYILRSAPPAAVRTGGALVATVRSEPVTFNRYIRNSFPTHLVSLLTQAPLVRINRISSQPEPWLASGWTASDDGRSITVDLREGVTWSDGVPFDAEDVVFSVRAAMDPGVHGPIADGLKVANTPIAVKALTPHRVVFTFAAPFAPGARLLDALPIYPRHVLEKPLADGTFRSAWGPSTDPKQMPGLGPFVLQRYEPGQRIVLARNPHYWRRDANGVQLPYLDRLTLEIVPDQNAELLRLTSGQVDVLQNEIRPEDYRAVKAAADAGRVRLTDVGPGIEREMLWFNLAPAPKGERPTLVAQDGFREAISVAIDRRAFANEVYLGAAEPSAAPVPPSVKDWTTDLDAGRYDPARAAARLDALGIVDRDNDGVREDATGRPARFSILVGAGITPTEKGAQFIRDSLGKIGVRVDVVPLDINAVMGRWMESRYDAIYHHITLTDTDPANGLDWWLSSGSSHLWHPNQKSPATAWEAQIDDLMARQSTTLDRAERQRLFAEVQRIFVAHNPAIYFVTPRIYVATSMRVAPAKPGLERPQILWAADELAVAK
jgi:peptide/nickel transport system substrate-binding protein